MAQITLQNLAHSYVPNPQSDADFALKQMDHVWQDGGAYALLGSRVVARRHCSTSSRVWCGQARAGCCLATGT